MIIILGSNHGKSFFMQAQHSKFNDFKGRVACGLPLISFRTKLDGPANQGFQTAQG